MGIGVFLNAVINNSDVFEMCCYSSTVNATQGCVTTEPFGAVTQGAGYVLGMYRNYMFDYRVESVVRYSEALQLDVSVTRSEDGSSYAIAVVNPNYLHAGPRFAPGTKLYCLMADMNLFRGRYVETTEEKFINPLIEGKIALRPKISGDDDLNELIRKCFRSFKGEELGYQLLLKSYFFELLYRLFRDYVQENNNDVHKRFVPVARERVNAILVYVNEHYAEKIRLEDLVDVVHINKYYICKIFQQCTGQTLLNYINIVRIQKAVEKLIGTNESVTQIAFSVGFQDINYFSRNFKKVMNVSPTDIRKKYRRD